MTTPKLDRYTMEKAAEICEAQRWRGTASQLSAAIDELRAHAATLPQDKVPEKVELPCGCYTAPNYEGCTCGNYDDAHSQGYAQGWNAAIDAAAPASGKGPK